MFTRRMFWGTILTIAGFELATGGVRMAARLHAQQDPEHTFPAKLGRAVVMSL